MLNTKDPKLVFEELGYVILDGIYTTLEFQQIVTSIKEASQNYDDLPKTKDLFAIRQLLNTIPQLKNILFNQKLLSILSNIYTTPYFLTKAIYFDKTSTSNWFVPYHQDLSISVNQKIDSSDYINWTYKEDQYGVQPPLSILENTITIRVHLDDTNAYNGALRVIPRSHQKGIIRLEKKDLSSKEEHICNVKKGGVMLMKPLTLHASNRMTNNKQRRVIHLEFCNQKLESPLEWLEYHQI